MVWVQTERGPYGYTGIYYLNLDETVRVRVIDPSNDGNWRVEYHMTDGSSGYLAGTWTAEADAQQVARELIDGVDPSTY